MIAEVVIDDGADESFGWRGVMIIVIIHGCYKSTIHLHISVSCSSLVKFAALLNTPV